MESRVDALLDRAKQQRFHASSSRSVGALLSTLAASKPGGQMLELGTGVGVGTIHLLDGMDDAARLTSVELDADLSSIAQRAVSDPRVTWIVADGGTWLLDAIGRSTAFDLVYADTWPGKFSHLDEALSLVAPGGLYVIDDLLPQDNWPAGHQTAVDDLVVRLESLPGWRSCRMSWATGVMVCTRQPDER